MPIYRYECPEKHPTWDELRDIKGSEASEEPCPTCGQTGRKVVSQVAVHFHGRGFTPHHFTGRKGKHESQS
jgi:putative FmdB family regulatory protein